MTSIHGRSKLVRGFHALASLTMGSLAQPRRTADFLRSCAPHPYRFIAEREVEATTAVAFSEFFGMTEPVQVSLDPAMTDRQYYNTRLDEEILIGIAVVQTQARSLFEIGTFNGETTRRMAEAAGPEGHVYTLDLTPETIDSFKSDWFKGSMIGEKFRDSPVASRITQLYVKANTFDFGPYYGKMDLVFVDADHEYASVLADSLAALRLVRPGGVILWHDFLSAWPGTVHAIKEATHGKSLVRISGTNLAALRMP